MEIEIPREIADAEGVPEDLDSNIVGPYRFPSPRRRRSAGWVYVVAGIIALATSWGPLPAGMRWVAAAFLALGAYHFVSAHPSRLTEDDALAIAGRLVDFPVGHASAALRFEGFRAQPVWNVLVYDAHDPPRYRALVFVDANTGDERRPAYTNTIDKSSVG